MSWFAIQRISDGKLLLRQTKTGRALVTWMKFDEGYAPHLYKKRSTAEKAMKMWQKGGWLTSGLKRVVKQPGRDVPVRVVEVVFTINVIPTETLSEHLAECRNQFSVLD